MALNQKQIESFKPTHKTTLSDGKGLLLEVTPTGTRRWYYRYAMAGKTRKMPLGYFPDVSLSSARAIAAGLLTQVRNGQDPLAIRDANLEATNLATQESEHNAALAAARMTFSQLFELWHQRQLATGRKDGGAEIRRSFDKDVLPKLGALYADQISRQQIAHLLNEIVARGAGRMANLTLTNLRQCFGWAIGAGLLENDPTSHLKKESFGGKETERDRTLSDDELRMLLQTLLPTSNITVKAKAAVRVILSTAVRVSELLMARREHINLEAREWYLPETKNGKPHMIQLSDFAATALAEILAIQDHPIWLFPDRLGSDHVCEKTLTKQIGARQCERENPRIKHGHATGLTLPGGRWTPHDLRRTAATLMGELGIRPDVIERCLNHVEENKVKRTYQRQTMIPERKAAFDVLGARLELLSNPDASNVIVLHSHSA